MNQQQNARLQLVERYRYPRVAPQSPPPLPHVFRPKKGSAPHCRRPRPSPTGTKRTAHWARPYRRLCDKRTESLIDMKTKARQSRTRWSSSLRLPAKLVAQRQ
jgi:hypothetical protein